MSLQSSLENNDNFGEAQALALGEVGVAPENAPDQRRQGFQRGRSGNPLGRPAGTYGRKMSPLKKLLDFESKEVLKTVVREAKAGNMQAANLLLSRTMPRERLVFLKTPRITDAATAMRALAMVIDCVVSGELTTREGADLTALAKAYVEIGAVAELKAQVEALQARMPAQ